MTHSDEASLLTRLDAYLSHSQSATGIRIEKSGRDNYTASNNVGRHVQGKTLAEAIEKFLSDPAEK